MKVDSTQYGGCLLQPRLFNVSYANVQFRYAFANKKLLRFCVLRIVEYWYNFLEIHASRRSLVLLSRGTMRKKDIVQIKTLQFFILCFTLHFCRSGK